MTVVRMGYVAMSVHLQNCSPSQTMTHARFKKLFDRDAAIRKLERIARSNVTNCLRLLKHNIAHDIAFFRLSSKLIPLANHMDLKGWNYIKSIKKELNDIESFLAKYKMRIDFHPDHFVLLNSKKVDILNQSIITLKMHRNLLTGMGIHPKHRCVLHVGGAYDDRDKALEQFIYNWGFVPVDLQEMIMLENDDKSFTMNDTLYLCEKLAIPIVFDYHHHLAHNDNHNWQEHWDRVVSTWDNSPLPIKMHISSPRSSDDFRAHADYIDAKMFLKFLREINGSVSIIDCMIEAKKKDDALFRLMKQLKHEDDVEIIDGASFKIH
ncbi:UV DNA damage repair endonuclease UvsE [Bacillus solimangrovi]|uniref:UV damage endonuclease UvsE n=1 Tax=Bacillus solimangrovi TaxID=1305675 RepID=A0A1E5LG61_9BACI|nr:UV DNA damage repair endonuclease UvsE [Bacillus solimangrovi]OEH93062.1 UV damage endonuclease UvsE [Bacillus solimangrovi]